jgi:zinc transporter ZupT
VRPRDRIYWLRALLGGAAGLLSYAITARLGEGVAYASLLIVIAGYLLTYYIARYIIAHDLPEEERNRWLSEGAGTYVMLWLFTYIVLSTIL